MSANTKFYSGLAAGLIISFVVFGGISLLKAKSLDQTELKKHQTNSGDDAVDGKWISNQDAAPLIAAFKNDVLTKLPANSSTGGFIKRSVLKEITNYNDGNYIKFEYYSDGDGKIGIMFQSSNNASQYLRTGSAAFCPMLCDYPN